MHKLARSLVLKLLVSALLLQQSPLWACSAFRLDTSDGPIVGKSFDWLPKYSHGAVFINPRRITRRAMGSQRSVFPAEWTSRYGSVTFTQFGQGLPIGGVNEKGLVIEMLMLVGTRYNSRQTQLPFVNEAQWTQYQLDHYATVEEVAQNLAKLRIDPLFVGIHYFLTDAGGKSAVVEFQKNGPVIYRGKTLPVPALTNSPYAELLARDRDAADSPLRTNKVLRTSKERFRILSRELASDIPGSMEKADHMLRRVYATGWAIDTPIARSQWQLLYDIHAGIVTFRSAARPKDKTLDWGTVDWDRLKKVWVYDMDSNYEGSIDDRLVPVTKAFLTRLARRNRLIFAWNPKLLKQAVAMGIAEGSEVRDGEDAQ